MSAPDEVLPDRRQSRGVQQFLETEAAGGMVLLFAALIALVWANSPWSAGYSSMWDTELGVGFGRYVLRQDLLHWVDDALMALFFLVVGLEIKRELVHGRLQDPRVAALPVVAALGGMVVPALLYWAVNAGGPGARGWGIPMATDIAFAVGVVAVVGRGVPTALRLFLLTLAVVDDLGAILVIAVFYPSDLRPAFLGLAALLVGAIAGLNRAGVQRALPYLVLGVALWLATFESGVHATIAGVALGLLMPVRDRAPGLGSPAARIARSLRPWTSFVVLPVFALANAGVTLKADAFDAPGAAAVTAGVMVGLVLGKTVGIAGAAWLATRLGIARMPDDTTWTMLVAIAVVGGIGFTVSLFVTELAFVAGPLQDGARLGVLSASIVAAIAGGVTLRRASGPATSRGGPGRSRRPGPRAGHGHARRAWS